MGEKIVLAYSGGLDTSVAIKLLQEKGFEVITMTVDVGQREDLKSIAEKAERLGVSKHYTMDAKEEFVEKFIFPALKANALYEGKYPVSSSLSRPLIAMKLVNIAEKEGASTVAHGCSGKGNDQVRFDVTIRALAPELKIIAPIRDWNWTRDKTLEYARKYGIPVPIKKSPYSIDQNLWGRSVECGPIEEADREPPPDAFEWTTPPEKAPDESEYVTISFKGGVPIALNKESLGGVSLIDKLNDLAGKHGVGRVDHIEDRIVGIKTREVYECPAATCLIEAHKDLEKTVLTRRELEFKRKVDEEWTFLIYSGLWVDPLREDLEAFIDSTQERVEGSVTIKLYKGYASVVGRSSPYSLYDMDLARYDIKSTFDQSLATGFIDLWSLPSRVARQLKIKKGMKGA